jgi:tRNA wybutosine-synthesizing protein 4
MQEPTITFRATPYRQASTVARFGASVIHHRNQVYLIGGILKDQILSQADEICKLDLDNCTTSPLLLEQRPETSPRPLLIGVSAKDTGGDSFVVMGGSAVCFSFGTFWNKGCYTFSTLRDDWDQGSPTRVPTASETPWRLVGSVAAAHTTESFHEPRPTDTFDQQPVGVPRVRIDSAEQFEQVLRDGVPVVLEKSSIGLCTSRWTTEYLKEKVGCERQVNI